MPVAPPESLHALGTELANGHMPYIAGAIIKIHAVLNIAHTAYYLYVVMKQVILKYNNFLPLGHTMRFINDNSNNPAG